MWPSKYFFCNDRNVDLSQPASTLINYNWLFPENAVVQYSLNACHKSNNIL